MDDDAERAFRDALHRVDSVRIPVPPVEAAQVRRASGPGLVVGRWVAAAALVALVGGLAIWALAGRGQSLSAAPAAPPSAPAKVMLTSATWVALEFYGKPAARANGATPYLNFWDDSTFNGGEFCNEGSTTTPNVVQADGPSGTYRLVGSELLISLDPKQQIGCDATEQQLVRKVLDATRTVLRSGDTIELLDQPGSVLARFRASAGHTYPGPVPTPTATDMPTAPAGPGPTAPTAARESPTSVPTPSRIENPAGIQIRVRNASAVDFTDVYAVFPDGKKVHYGPVLRGGVSFYQQVDQAYGYAYLKVTTAARSYVYQPVDYVGESLLKPGEHTYALSLVNGQLDLKLE